MWVMVPSYALAYVVLLWTIAFTAKALDGGAGNVDERSGSAQLPYHDLKRHFALARRWELDTTESSTPTDIAATLRNAKERLDLARSNNMVLGSLQPADYLNRWSAVLTNP
ncbi:hypothetical protein MAHJHV51_29210 [Mycobacterium avium subsp. hominissuis]